MRICSTNVEQVPKKMKTTEKYSPFNAVISENYVFLRSKQFHFRREREQQIRIGRNKLGSPGLCRILIIEPLLNYIV